jgi:hypothetical protein
MKTNFLTNNYFSHDGIDEPILLQCFVSLQYMSNFFFFQFHS